MLESGEPISSRFDKKITNDRTTSRAATTATTTTSIRVAATTSK
jgi:hypothetical protein